MNLLVADDDPAIIKIIADYLELHNITVDFAYHGKQVLELCSVNRYDVLVIDVMMPYSSGFSVCSQLRDLGCTTPILMLTGLDSVDDKVKGFEAGADDYLVKPFALEELYHRICALSKRISRHEVRVFKHGELELDFERHVAKRCGQELALNPVQFKILHFLATKAPQVVTRDELEQELWGDERPSSDALRSHLYQLRQVLDKPFDFPMMETLHGVGVRLKAPDEEREDLR